MLVNNIYFGFQSIFISFGLLSLISIFISFFLNLGYETILFITCSLNILIIYLINFFKKKKDITNKNFIFISLIIWLIIILISVTPLFELLKDKTLNEKIFFATSLVTTTGLNILDNNYSDNIILAIWISNIQIIGALYTIFITLLYYTLYIKKNNNKLLIVNKQTILIINFLFISFLITFTIILQSYDFNLVDSFSLASAILSSGGITASESVFLKYNINHFIVTLLMIISLLILPIYFYIINKKNLKYEYKKIKNLSFRFFLFIILMISFITFTGHLSYSENLFLAASFITTTGILPYELENNYSLLEYNKFFFLFLFFSIIGTFSGTTNGGIKINKVGLLLINIKEEFNNFLFQYNVKGIEIIKKGTTQKELDSFYAATGFGVFLLLISILILNISDLDLKSSLVYAVSALSNTGEGLILISSIKEKVSPSYYIILNILMICGRFESIGYLLLFNKVFKN
ncbi:MAG: hypothetical protein CMP40_02490 [Rickettsiales bacterium]|nr:hypothetical protein [Rickettsiales bacterium]|tara:strand:+ start:6 stop:1394 length:1389 start_codon:yes stop_codon:yes gene_type:complete